MNLNIHLQGVLLEYPQYDSKQHVFVHDIFSLKIKINKLQIDKKYALEELKQSTWINLLYL